TQVTLDVRVDTAQVSGPSTGGETLGARNPSAAATATLEIVADIHETTREAKDLSRFMKTEGGLVDHSPEEIKAFQRVGFEAKVMAFFSASGKASTGSWDGVIVLPQGAATSPHSNRKAYRKSQQAFFLDTGDFDRLYRGNNQAHGYKIQLFEINVMPRSLSSHPEHEKSWGFAPKSLEAFGAAVEEAARHIKEHHRVNGAKYLVFGEPEANNLEDGTWFGCGPIADYCKPGDDPAELYYKTFTTAYHAIKRADRTAEIIGPTSGVCDANLARRIANDTRKGFDEFVEAIALYNRTNTATPVNLTTISWQGYDWDGSGRLTDCVEQVKRTLARNGFDPEKIKQHIIGWNGNWATSDPIPMPAHKRAAYLAANILEQVKPNGGKIDIEEAYIYTWNLGRSPDPVLQGSDPGQGLVSTKPRKGKEGICLEAPYAAMEMLHEMRGGTREGKGHFVRTTLAGVTPGRVQVATTKHARGKFIMMIANNSKETYLMNLAFDRLPFPEESEVYYSVQRIDASNGSTCRGLEKGTTHKAKLTYTKDKRALKLPTLALPQHSITMVTVWPAGK
ncbi:MAG TPA: hypothetical protein VFM35_02300, partial [Candidatus Binatia bacterium]|nr:hypothetical protein [Candidatus Binatia bacterium]